MENERYHIALFTSLAKDLRYAAVLIRSIAEHFRSPEQLVFHFLFYDLEPQDLSRLIDSLGDLPVELEFYPLDSQVGDRRFSPGFGYWAWMWAGRVRRRCFVLPGALRRPPQRLLPVPPELRQRAAQ